MAEKTYLLSMTF